MTIKQFKTTIYVSIMTISMLMVTPFSVHAEPEIDLPSLVDQYGEIAEINIEAGNQKQFYEEKLDNEMSKTQPDTVVMSELQAKIDEQAEILNTTNEQLENIQSQVKERLQMDPELKKELYDAKQILRESLDKIPWTGLGVSRTYEAITISIDAEDPESYRTIIENLVGDEIPVIIKQGGNPFMTCSSRTTDCSDLQGGLRIGDFANPAEPDCTLGFPVEVGTTKGWLTAGHCYSLETDVYQPDSDSGKIGDVDDRVFSTFGDGAFIKKSSNDAWDEHKIYKDSNDEYEVTNTDNPSEGTLVAMSAGASDVIDWGYVDDPDFTCSYGGDTVDGLYKTNSTAINEGDSGSPVFNPTWDVDKFYGVASCSESTTDDDMVFENWDTLVTHLGVS